MANYLSLDGLTHYDGKIKQWVKDTAVEQVSTMGTASKAGIIVEYVGDTTTDYTQGYFYVSYTTDAGKYAWKQINVQPDVTLTDIIDDTQSVTNKTYSSSKIDSQIKDNAKDATYKAETSAGAGDEVTIAEAIKALEDEGYLNYKGTTTAAITSPADGDLYYFNIAATSTDPAVIGWKFYSTADTAWKDLNDATLATRVEALETQVGKDKSVNTYQSKTDLVDIVNVLTGANTVDGSVAKAVKDAVDALDTSADIALATATEGVVTIKAVKEADGVIAASTDTTLDVTLAKVATTGTAADVAIVDADNLFITTNVESALYEVKMGVNTNNSKIFTLNANDNVSGSVDYKIKHQAADAIYGDEEYTTYICWEDSNFTYYTESATPKVGDTIYIYYKDTGIFNVFDTVQTVATDNSYITDSAGGQLNRNADHDLKLLTDYTSIKEAIANISTTSSVTVEKLGTATEGYASSYIVKQNGTQVGATIDIPKDYLVKSAKLVHYVAAATANKYYEIVSDPNKTTEVDLPSYISTAQVGKDLIDFTVNTAEGTGTESHIVIDVTHLVDVYTGKTVTDGISVAVSDTYEISATVSGKAIARTNIDDDFEDDIAALEGTHAKDDTSGALKSVAAEIKTDAEKATYTKADATTTTIQAAIQALEASATDTNGALVFKGTIAATTDFPAAAKVGDTYLVGDATSGYKLYTCTVAADASASPAVAQEIKELAIDSNFLTALLGTDYKIADVASTVKAYIDSRIFVGTQDEYDAAIAAKTIDSTVFAVITDESAEALVAITNDEIDKLFS